MINVEQAITLKYPKIGNYPKFFSKAFFSLLKLLFHEKDINEFLVKYENASSIEFIEAVLEYFNFSYSVTNKDRENIPASGKVVIIANHPLGALDALSLIKLVSEVRSDIKIVANDMLSQIEQLKDLILPVDNLKGGFSKESIKRIYNSLEKEEAVIIFPSGEVSRARVTGIKDVKWKNGFLKFAKKANAPILPIYINAKNSTLFYTVSSINKSLSSMLLVHEMFNKNSKIINFKVGEIIPRESLNFKGLSENIQINLFKKHLYKLSKNKKGVFITERGIAHPENRQLIKRELMHSKALGQTVDNKKIYLFEYDTNSAIMKEIGRLREMTFRRVGEGSGKRRDLDDFDIYYKHLILWDEEELEIVGAYRIGESNLIMDIIGDRGFYTKSLFDFSSEFKPYLRDSIELGRSFVQPKYWGTRALDYLWQGIGAYLKNHPNIKYMFGGVSLSDSYPKVARDMIIYFYSKYFGCNTNLVMSKNRYLLDEKDINEFELIFSGDYKSDFRKLKEQLNHFNVTVPTLYKQYSELCNEDGIKFLDFGVDKDFNDCVDGFILVEIDKIKELKRKRYMGE